MSLIEEPARKVFIKQCSDLIIDNSSKNSRHRKWILNRSIKTTFGLIWIQGIITNVTQLNEAITLDDGSDEALIVSIKEAHGFGTWIQKGQYAMVIGEVLSVQPDIQIKAVKLTHLVEPNAEILWILEVIHFWKYLEATGQNITNNK